MIAEQVKAPWVVCALPHNIRRASCSPAWNEAHCSAQLYLDAAGAVIGIRCSKYTGIVCLHGAQRWFAHVRCVAG
jgi:hypothetical protein